jgi:hypothetical protein
MKKVTLKLPALYLIPGHRISPVSTVAEYALAYLSMKGAKSAREQATERLATPVKYGLTEKSNPTTAKLASLPLFWALIDLCNAEPWEGENGRAYVFIFATRQAARDYRDGLIELKKIKPTTIDVTAPVQYFVQ